jgi:hypothetical protein
MPHVGLFGAPEHIVSDNGGQFMADLIAEMTQLMGTLQVPITPYSHEENSRVERSHGETLKHLRAIVFERLTHKYALTEWECLLQGRQFTVRTDHANMRYMRDSPSEKVNRWKMAVQRFDALFEHIRGKFNNVADPFSRLVHNFKDVPAGENNKTQPGVERIKLNMIKVPHLFKCTTLEGIVPKTRKEGLGAAPRARTELPLAKRVLIATAHNGVVGHHGVQRTRGLLTQKQQRWEGMSAHIRQFIGECAYCQKAAFKTPSVLTAP